ncbi:MAG: hypothetical protein U0P81_03845 [Holophagaceae bacterium]
MTLQRRAREFLERPVPEDIDYVEGSLAERLLTAYAEEGRIDSDPEQLELLELCLQETRGAEQEGSPARRAWFKESGDLLEAILAETS